MSEFIASICVILKMLSEVERITEALESTGSEHGLVKKSLAFNKNSKIPFLQQQLFGELYFIFENLLIISDSLELLQSPLSSN